MKISFNHWVLLGAISIGIMSCGGSDPQPSTSQIPPLLPLDEPVAEFTSVVTDNTVVFTNKSTNGISYSWVFGDGQTSTDQNPTHTYAGGNYLVKLTVTGAEGTTLSRIKHQVSIAFKFGPNLIQGGGLAAEDESKWTFTDSDLKGPTPNYAFGVAQPDSLPSTSDGIGLLIKNTPGRDPALLEGALLSQMITLKAGRYSFSVDAKISAGPGTTTVWGPNYHSWFEWYISPDAPVTGEGFADHPIINGSAIHRERDWIYGNSYTGPFVAVNGSFSGDAVKSIGERVDDNGLITIDTDGTYYVIFAFGKANSDAATSGYGSYGLKGIGVDNVSLRKVD